jgi:TPR repeat protein
MTQNTFKCGFQLQLASLQHADAEAEHNLAVSYEYGHGVKQEWPLAIHWYRESAAQGGMEHIETNFEPVPKVPE